MRSKRRKKKKKSRVKTPAKAKNKPRLRNDCTARSGKTGRAFLLPNGPKNGREASFPGGRGAPGDGSRGPGIHPEALSVQDFSERIEPPLAKTLEMAKTYWASEGYSWGYPKRCRAE